VIVETETFEFEYKNDLLWNNIILKIMLFYHIFLHLEHKYA